MVKKGTEREKYDATLEKVKRAEGEIDSRRTSFLRTANSRHIESGHWAKVDYSLAKKKLDKLYEKSHTDAIKLNKKYDVLVNQLKKDTERVYGFEKDKLDMHKDRGKGLVGIASVVLMVGGIFFLSPNLTGNAISNLTNQTSNIIGAGLFLMGIVGSYFWSRKK